MKPNKVNRYMANCQNMKKSRKTDMTDEADEGFEARKEDLINTIEWYMNEYHRSDHSEMIKEVRSCKTEEELINYEKLVDGWLDY